MDWASGVIPQGFVWPTRPDSRFEMEKSESRGLYFKLSSFRVWVGGGGKERGQSTRLRKNQGGGFPGSLSSGCKSFSTLHHAHGGNYANSSYGDVR